MNDETHYYHFKTLVDKIDKLSQELKPKYIQRNLCGYDKSTGIHYDMKKIFSTEEYNIDRIETILEENLEIIYMKNNEIYYCILNYIDKNLPPFKYEN